jgi:hypothetical protein
MVEGGVVAGVITQTDLLAAAAGMKLKPRQKELATTTSYDI